MWSIFVGEARDNPDAVAPDGIPIHLVLCDFHTIPQHSAVGPMRFVSVAEGRIAPGQWGVHAHFSLEQVTYVLEGEVIVQTRDTAGGDVHSVTLTPGQALVTLPTQTLSFANPGAATARVLFICAPPYPADDSDTLMLRRADAAGAEDELWLGAPPAAPAQLAELHRPLTREELERAIEQQERMKEQVSQVFEERIAVLRGSLAERKR